MKRRRTPFLIIVLLFILYILQGVILGFTAAIPFYLDSYGATWQEQGTFVFGQYPFSLKLAWAPILDAIYNSRIGRRKTWLIPTQLFIGITLFILSFFLTTLIRQLRITLLTVIFFMIFFLLSSQDISVDGWALTLLRDYNIQWASTSQTVGQTFGRFLGFTGLITFESANFTNQFIRKPFSLEEKSYGLFTLNQFIRFWSIIFILTAFCIALFKKEKEETNHLNLKETYLAIFQLFKKQCVRQITFLFFTGPIGYAATYAMTNLVLKKHGVPQETLGLFGIPLIIVKVIVPFCITHTNRPLIWYYRSYSPRLCMSVLIAIYVCFTPYILSKWYFYPLLICLFLVNESFIYLMTVSRVGVYARISDPCIGGTYITLLAMIGNLGASLTSSAVLYAAGWIKPEKVAYPILVGICVVSGTIWLLAQYRTMMRLHALPIEEWHLSKRETKSNEHDGETFLNEDKQ